VRIGIPYYVSHANTKRYIVWGILIISAVTQKRQHETGKHQPANPGKNIA
jgi:hypothetical protein